MKKQNKIIATETKNIFTIKIGSYELVLQKIIKEMYTINEYVKAIKNLLSNKKI